jgi:hypothetical protein
MPRILIGSLCFTAALLGGCAHEHRSAPTPTAAADYPPGD